MHQLGLFRRLRFLEWDQAATLVITSRSSVEEPGEEVAEQSQE